MLAGVLGLIQALGFWYNLNCNLVKQNDHWDVQIIKVISTAELSPDPRSLNSHVAIMLPNLLQRQPD